MFARIVYRLDRLEAEVQDRHKDIKITSHKQAFSLPMTAECGWFISAIEAFHDDGGSPVVRECMNLLLNPGDSIQFKTDLKISF